MLPQILREDVLGMRGGWVIKGRLVVYHNTTRRVELMLEQVERLQEVGWTLDDLQQLQTLLADYKRRLGE